MRAARAFAKLLSVSLAGLALQTAPAPAMVLPSSMAAAGDSITLAFDAGPGCQLRECPQYSWATGNDPSVHSHYQRLLAANPGLAGNIHNDARLGARMADLESQLRLAAAQRAAYVTIGMGANDVCSRTIDGMTPSSAVGRQLESALADFTAAQPQARVYLSSIPNLYTLWQVMHENSSARLIWGSFHVCESMLAERNSAENRLSVLHRIEADNQVMAEVCATFRACRWDGGAAFQYQFTADDISSLDFFHPSLLGQSRIAALTWAAGYWPSLGMGRSRM